MIIYNSTKNGFLHDVADVENILTRQLESKLGEIPSEGEIRSWHNSLRYMAKVIDTQAIPDDTGIALEYNIPVTNNRIDFMITGMDDCGKPQVVMIELKQWQYIQVTDKDGVVSTRYEDGIKETTHPSYQVACYASLLYDFKEAVQKHDVNLHPCVFMHNYVDDGMVTDMRYNKYIQKAPIFCKNDDAKLRDFITRYVKKSDQNKSIYVLENSRVVPSKSLIDSVVNMAAGKPEFKMIDEQKVAYQNILWAYDEYLRTGKKQVVVVKGGPGTGKSVIAVKLLIEMTRRKLLAHYVTKNVAPRNVFYKKFMESKDTHSAIKNLFKSSGSYYTKKLNEFDMLIVDEAHRLQQRSGLYANQGENQIKEIIMAAKVAVFFIDEHQIVDFRDIGSVSEIEKWAQFWEADILHQQLIAQLRCSGSDEYLHWVDYLLQYGNYLPVKLSGTTYDFRVFDSASDMMAEIKKLNRYRNKSRVVAGFCWDWISRGNDKLRANDIVIGDDFSYKWNFSKDSTWSITKGSVDQIGCIHTCQGLEFDYIGVIIGEDIICRNGKILVQPSRRSKNDKTLFGWKKMMEENEEATKQKVRLIIKNTYRTLMTRGMKGCFVYVCDEELRNYIKHWI